MLGKKVTKAGNSEVPRMVERKKKNDRQLNSSQNCIELKAKLMVTNSKKLLMWRRQLKRLKHDDEFHRSGVRRIKFF